MEIKDAIERIKWRIETIEDIAGKGTDGKALEDLEMAVRALELQEKGKLKEDPVKAIHVHYTIKKNGRVRHTVYCGVCGKFVQRITLGDNYCRNCGTRVGWRIENGRN